MGRQKVRGRLPKGRVMRGEQVKQRMQWMSSWDDEICMLCRDLKMKFLHTLRQKGKNGGASMAADNSHIH